MGVLKRPNLVHTYRLNSVSWSANNLSYPKKKDKICSFSARKEIYVYIVIWSFTCMQISWLLQLNLIDIHQKLDG